MSESLPVSRADIDAAGELIRPYVRRTPTIELAPDDLGLTNQPLTLKLELLQHSGSFKARGAFTNLLTRDVPPAGVVAASGGNHGAAVAYAAQRLGVPARIFVPSISSQAKMDRIRSYGAELVVAGDLYADALAASQAWVAESGAMEVHAYDQRETLIGQGTTAMEWQEQSPTVDTVLVSVGGGGLIGGMASWYRGDVRVIGVEPELAPTLHNALANGAPVDSPAGGVAADSLAPKQVGGLMFPIAQACIEKVVLVPDNEIVSAQRTLWHSLRLATEPGAATALAALLCGAYEPSPDERVGVLVCGGNTVAVDL